MSSAGFMGERKQRGRAGRPLASDPRKPGVSACFTTEEIARLRAAAERAGKPLGVIVKGLFRPDAPLLWTKADSLRNRVLALWTNRAERCALRAVTAGRRPGDWIRAAALAWLHEAERKELW